jgi:hypothetical protein
VVEKRFVDSIGVLLTGFVHQTGNRTAVAGDLNFFTACHAIEKLGQMRLRLVGTNGFRDKAPR